MFQDTLLIIKSDYMAKRKTLLIYLLRQGFQIKGHRKIHFTPELAAKFYDSICDDPNFMLHVILLSKGPSEAFILAKECAVEDLVNCLVCYFGNSVDMDKNVHTTKYLGQLRKDFSFIFPNYIFEPINRIHPEYASLKSEIYAIVTEPESDNRKIWKQQLVDWVIFPHKDRPGVSGQCSHHPDFNLREMAQQTDDVTVLKRGCRKGQQENHHLSVMCFDSDGTSLNLTTSSCVTCSNFSSTDICAHQKRPPFIDVIKAKTAKLTIPKTSSSSEDLKKDEGVSASEEIKDEDSTRSSILKYAESDQISLTAISDVKPEGTPDAALEVSVVKVESEQFEIGEAFTVIQSEEALDKYDENSIDLQHENQIDSGLSPENEALSETISSSAN